MEPRTVEFVSRSIHTTRRDADREPDREKKRRLRERVGRKREIKAASRGQRKVAGRQESAFPPVEAEDGGPSVHYPASPEDLANLIERLPSGALNGVRGVELAAPREGEAMERLPGVFCGRLLGRYLPRSNRIEVFGFVSERPLEDHWSLYLRLHMLSTFAHEVGHHDDRMRASRGRGRGEGEEDAEIHAERRQQEWTRRYVLPYLEESYPAEVAALQRWVEEHGGHRFELEELAGDSRTSVRGGRITLDGIFGGVPGALEHLAKDVSEGADARTAKIGFARDLHHGARYAVALVILESILRDDRDHVPALNLEADVLEHLERYDEAERIARAVIDREPSSYDAWHTLELCFEDQERWTDALETADRCLELCGEGNRELHISTRVRALIGLGELTRAREELAGLERMGARGRRMAGRLRPLLAGHG